MYTAKQKDPFVSNAVSLIIWGLLHPNCKYDDFYTLSDVGDVQPLFATDRISIQPPEDLFDAWRDTIEVYGNANEDDHVRELEYDEEWLGQYSPMSSPGKIILSIHTIRDAFDRHIRDLISAGYPVTFFDFRNLAFIFIRKTVYHEYFHHYSDIQRHLYGSYYSKDTEEALAVAWSRMKIEWYSSNKKFWKTPLDFKLCERFKKAIFNFWQPGYKDWDQYYNPVLDEKSVFCDTVRTYTMPSGSSKLRDDGIRFETLILGNLDTIYQTSDALTLHYNLR